MMGEFTELAVHFGRSASLLGILSRPPSRMPIRKPAVVVLNTGIAHRVGHHRMYVKMARELAALGHIVFRFDFSGIGDSPPRADILNPIEAHQADLSEALDWLTASCDVNEVILIGLCAGAEIALRYGHSDKRVIGFVLLDPTIPPTARFYAHYIGRRLIELRSWWSFVCGRGRIREELSEWARSAFGAATSQSASTANQKIRSELEQLYLKSFERKLNVLIVVTGRVYEGRQSYREQLFDAFPNVPLKGWVSLEYHRDADHTFTSEEARAALQELVLGWIKALPITQNLPQTSSGDVVPTRGANRSAGGAQLQEDLRRGSTAAS
jgi:pimeloyl-ACP methyl ester carboxylesterase